MGYRMFDTGNVLVGTFESEWEIEGQIECYLEDSLDRAVAIIESLYVVEEVRNSGIGSHLLSKICDYADDNSILLKVNLASQEIENIEQAIHMYSEQGFVDYRSTGLFYRQPICG